MSTLKLNGDLYQEFVTILCNPVVKSQLKYFPVWKWLSEHGVDPRDCANKETNVVLVKGAMPAVQFEGDDA